ncbi:peptidoglycan-associated lipoprotein Pal [Radicibacter daui]|uniref:peptidoglycan-associated lipoprotein Pal n=1 Tax=Radicibacter daui TaxID=3064829 RepID=UPI004046C459
MNLKFLSMAAAVLLLAACSSDGEDSSLAASDGGYNSGANAGSNYGANGSDISSSSMQGNVQPGSQEDLAVNVGDRVLFGFDQYNVSSEGQQILSRQAEWLRRYPSISVTIEGHSDERGTREYNLALGDRRATAVKNYLIAAGISGSRISTVSFGKERPAAVGSNESAWAQNRRAVTTIN